MIIEYFNLVSPPTTAHNGPAHAWKESRTEQTAHGGADLPARFETTSDATVDFVPAPRHPIRSRSPRARAMTR